MEKSLLPRLEAGIARLQALSPDGATYENGIGFSGQHVQIGAALASSVGNWTPRMALAAWRVCRRYANTQLAGLDIPPAPALDDSPDAVVFVKEFAAQSLAAAQVAANRAETAENYGLSFSAWRAVNTVKGLMEVRNAPPSQDFWALWRTKKDALKAAGLGVSQYNGAWVVAQWRTPARQAQVSGAELGAELPIGDTSGLLAYQHASVEKLSNAIRRNRAAVDASDTGTGKTYVALAAFRELGLSPLIVAPKAVLASWQRAGAHFGIVVRAVNYELVRRGNTPFGGWVGEGRSKRFVWAADVEALVFDEAHRCKGHSTQNALLVRGAADQRIPTVAASATLAHNPLEMRAVGHLLRLHNWTDFWSWSKGYGCRPAFFGGFEFTGESAHLEKLNRQIFPSRGVRIRVADLGSAFPETQIAAELLNLGADAKKLDAAYAEMEAELARLEKQKAADRSGAAAAALTAALRARQHAEILKVPAFVERVEDSIEEGFSVFLAVNFRETLHAVLARLESAGIKAGAVFGGQDAAERQSAIDAFQADTLRVIVVMIQAGGVGISLHDLNGNFPRIALISPTWSAVELRQALGRVHRAGGKTKSLQRILFAAGTVEEKVHARVADKLAKLDTLNDGDLSDGVDTAAAARAA